MNTVDWHVEKELSTSHSREVRPLVSIIMNCYNGEKFLREAIDSVLMQTFQNWEIIFWDNQSTDKSAEIFKSYQDPRLKYFYAPNHTVLYAARNRALMEARGEFIAFLDVDDWWDADKLQLQLPLFQDPKVGLVYGNYWLVDQGKKRKKLQYKQVLPDGWVLDAILRHYVIGMLTMVVRRSILLNCENFFDKRFQVIGDFDLAVRIARNYKFSCSQMPIAYYRWHGGNRSIIERDRQISELETWLTESDLPQEKLRYVQYNVFRNKILCALQARNYRYALRHFLGCPMGLLKLRILGVVVRDFIS